MAAPRTRRQVALAMLIGAATVLHIIEQLLPPLPVPGAKIGLANAPTLIALRLMGFSAGVWVSLVRSVLGGLLSGFFFGPGFWMGFAGAVASALAIGLAVRMRRFADGNVGVSVIGAAAHSLSQLAVAVALLRHPGLWLYLPMLLGLSILTGVFIGLACDRVIKLVASRRS
jgi:heptaprenyl diphosphate synthase